jgi:hypothetical protein
VKASIAYWDQLKALFLGGAERGMEDAFFQGLSVALSGCATKAQYSELVEMLSAEGVGSYPDMFLHLIKRWGGESGIRLLESLREDPKYGRGARALLRRRHVKRS